MNRFVASQLRSIEQVAREVVVAPSSGRFTPLSNPGHVYICFENRVLFWRPSRPIAETYNLRLTGEGLVISSLQNGRLVTPPTLVPYHLVAEIKFYYRESCIRIQFTGGASSEIVGALPVQNPLCPRLLYANFVLEAERVRLLETLVSARMLDFARSPAPRRGGFAVRFLDRLVAVRHAGGVAISDLVNFVEDEPDDDEEVLEVDEQNEWFDALNEGDWPLMGRVPVNAAPGAQDA